MSLQSIEPADGFVVCRIQICAIRDRDVGEEKQAVLDVIEDDERVCDEQMHIGQHQVVGARSGQALHETYEIVGKVPHRATEETGEAFGQLVNRRDGLLGSQLSLVHVQRIFAF